VLRVVQTLMCYHAALFRLACDAERAARELDMGYRAGSVGGRESWVRAESKGYYNNKEVGKYRSGTTDKESPVRHCAPVRYNSAMAHPNTPVAASATSSSSLHLPHTPQST